MTNQPETTMVAIDGSDALAFVIIRPGATKGSVSIEAAAKGLSKPAAAHVLHHVATQWNEETEIPMETAAHVLWQDQLGGWPPSTFATKLLSLWTSADTENAERLAVAFPGYAAAIALVRSGQQGIEQLRAIAGDS
ncbi:hypothetical protein DIZ27_23215 [Streptomyces sp. NWU339]|uniref:hypothetical protein n=1 Tax=Streptomyces sp. NWU339 TaxID=2185284 RepID=UPI000D6723C8|nr:hypothetical protein [Streptomyces sp. NWU339]PWI08351.1 hypothetical protein DIZ27_23215 [Streptomyces sp. NWU339]